MPDSTLIFDNPLVGHPVFFSYIQGVSLELKFLLCSFFKDSTLIFDNPLVGHPVFFSYIQGASLELNFCFAPFFKILL